ncbi:MAG: threonine ammonia-lyase [Actinobacteria bacterium]|nr:threonine ammonia-lyase [Actinomycetota bacterium]
MKTAGLVSLAEIREAEQRLEGIAVTTPLDRSRALSERAHGPVFVKCENLQRTGSFKIRGAYNRLSRLDDAAKASGVVAASAGNHAQGVALAATLLGIRSKVFMPEAAAIPKVEATKRYGAEVVLFGEDLSQAVGAATEHASECGSEFIHPFDHPHIIAGQGTIGLEIAESMGDIGTVVVPVGGGGLISGVAGALKALRPGVRVVGVQAAGAASLPACLEKNEIIEVPRMSTIADGIAVKAPGELTLAHISELVDDVVLVNDEAIAKALVFTTERMKLVLEPSGAAGVAAVLQGSVDLPTPIVVLLSGGNIDPLLLLRIIRFGMSASGRYFAFHTHIGDRPGALHRLLGLVAEVGANVVGVEHRREGVRVHLEEVDVSLQVETKGRDHITELLAALNAAGYVVERL